MISFGDLKYLRAAIEAVSMQYKKDNNDVSTCLRIRQLEKNLTEFTTSDGVYYTYKYLVNHTVENSGGDAGQEYLVNTNSFYTNLAYLRNLASILVFKSTARGLQISTAEVVNGRLKQRHNRTCHVYGGETSDFVELPVQSQVIAIARQHWEVGVRSFCELCDLKSRDTDHLKRPGCIVRINAQEKHISFTGTNSARETQTNAQVILPIELVDEHTEDVQFYLSALNVARLRALSGLSRSEPVLISINDLENPEYITFSSSCGMFTVANQGDTLYPGLERELNTGSFSPVDYIDNEPTNTGLARVQAERVVPINQLPQAALIQGGTGITAEATLELLLAEEDSYLRLCQAKNFGKTDYSDIDITPVNYYGSWPVVRVPAKYLTLVNNPFKRAASRADSAEQVQVRMILKTATNPYRNINVYWLHLEPTPSAFQMRAVRYVNLAEHVLDQLDTGE